MLNTPATTACIADRLNDVPGPAPHRLWMAAFRLKNDEFKAWYSLINLGLEGAARCAEARYRAAWDAVILANLLDRERPVGR